ncbi:NADH dehydrogenase [ubiquinone] 1 alpha subcomplex subunit 10, mitochondrial [Holothuria leucospilota]|uniref:NADH dehydrogenase [ubiquinone] 1 alpha subcomplex subunit 10, mitochondrial n=1 Tax=Holothuria leucospilota TaxID=206669 RepID=A0A9Q1BH30_HOLLE|nr:NADH dehydrogenase [ubiquinone] 1 alpha subcomplex subunit 10, mitochondrial [Holothuria leucospilota]
MAFHISKIAKQTFQSGKHLCKVGQLLRNHTQVRTVMTETPLTFVFGYKFMHKFDENSKIIVLDGNLAVGKTTMAADLADKLGMKYFPECHVHYMDEKVMGSGQKCDSKFSGDVSLDRFYEDPLAKDGHTFRFQMVMYALRFLQYRDVVLHLLETGQGVVMERSVYSDFVFLEAIMDMGWIRRECYDYYNQIKGLSLYRMKHPHAVVYLDVPPEFAHQRFVERGKGYEKNVPLEYFQALDKAYKQKYLPEMKAAGVEVLHYDWKSFGDVDRIADDIGYLKCEDSVWNTVDNAILDRHYRFLANEWKVLSCMNIPRFVPEITYGGQQFEDLIEEYKLKYHKRYAPGFNEGDYKSKWEIMFKR